MQPSDTFIEYFRANSFFRVDVYSESDLNVFKLIPPLVLHICPRFKDLENLSIIAQCSAHLQSAAIVSHSFSMARIDLEFLRLAQAMGRLLEMAMASLASTTGEVNTEGWSAFASRLVFHSCIRTGEYNRLPRIPVQSMLGSARDAEETYFALRLGYVVAHELEHLIELTELSPETRLDGNCLVAMENAEEVLLTARDFAVDIEAAIGLVPMRDYGKMLSLRDFEAAGHTLVSEFQSDLAGMAVASELSKYAELDARGCFWVTSEISAIQLLIAISDILVDGAITPDKQRLLRELILRDLMAMAFLIHTPNFAPDDRSRFMMWVNKHLAARKALLSALIRQIAFVTELTKVNREPLSAHKVHDIIKKWGYRNDRIAYLLFQHNCDNVLSELSRRKKTAGEANKAGSS